MYGPELRSDLLQSISVQPCGILADISLRAGPWLVAGSACLLGADPATGQVWCYQHHAHLMFNPKVKGAGVKDVFRSTA